MKNCKRKPHECPSCNAYSQRIAGNIGKRVFRCNKCKIIYKEW